MHSSIPATHHANKCCSTTGNPASHSSLLFDQPSGPESYDRSRDQRMDCRFEHRAVWGEERRSHKMFGPNVPVNPIFSKMSHLLWTHCFLKSRAKTHRIKSKDAPWKKRRTHTFQTSNRITALAPSTFDFPILANRGAKSGVFHSTTCPVQKNRMMRGVEVKEQNMIVTRLFSSGKLVWRWRSKDLNYCEGERVEIKENEWTNHRYGW